MASRPTKIRQAAALEKVMLKTFGHEHHDMPVAQKIREELAGCMSAHEKDLVGGSLTAWVAATTEKLADFVKKGGTLHGGGPSQSLAPALGTRRSLSAFTGAPEAKPNNVSSATDGPSHGEFSSYSEYMNARKRGRGASSLNVLGVSNKSTRLQRNKYGLEREPTLPSIATTPDSRLEAMQPIDLVQRPDILFNYGGSTGGPIETTHAPPFRGQKYPPQANRS